ncbi:MAG: hypothetical protein JNK16_13935 [Phycisphaerales bacterium]|nr:hypothetical protein [Phycisphaerales bacterium]
MDHTFYKLSSRGRADEGDADTRSTAELEIDEKLLWKTACGKRVVGWPKRVKLRLDQIRNLDDMLWTGGFYHVVSDRLRMLLEEKAPNHTQFLRVYPYFRGRAADVGPYWVANWLFVVDCLDREATDWFSTGEISIPAIRVSKIPRSKLVFRIEGAAEYTVAHARLKDLVTSSGLRGCQFYQINQK